MIVLDTNVVSELARPAPDPVAAAWFARQVRSELRLTAVTVGEVRFGIERMPLGRRRDEVAAKMAELGHRVGGEILAYDRTAAERYGVLIAARIAGGRPMGIADAQIAAICRARGAVLATRNLSDFEDTGVQLIDPWSDAPS